MTTETKRVSGRMWVFLAILASVEKARREEKDGPTIREISQILYEFESDGIRLEDVALRPVPGGFSSETVHSQCVNYQMAGFATKVNPFVLTDEGRRELWRLFGEILMDYKMEVMGIAMKFGLL